MKRGIRALTLTFNYYIYFWKGVAVRIEYLVGVKYLSSTFSSSLVCADLSCQVCPGVADVQVSRAAVLNRSCPHPVSSQGAEVSYSACALRHAPNYCSPRIGVIRCLFLRVGTTSDWNLNCSSCSYIFPSPPRPVGGFVEGRAQADATRAWALHLPGCTHSECLEKCPSKSLQIKCHRQKQRLSSVRRSMTRSKNYVMCKVGEKSKLGIQDMEAVVLLPRVLWCSPLKAAEISTIPPVPQPAPVAAVP